MNRSLGQKLLLLLLFSVHLKGLYNVGTYITSLKGTFVQNVKKIRPSAQWAHKHWYEAGTHQFTKVYRSWSRRVKTMRLLNTN
jgi:hypothetical protein